jgi:2,4-diketo-3-deoxy-L-fuconate hydrolase
VRIVRFRVPSGGAPRVGWLHDDEVVDAGVDNGGGLPDVVGPTGSRYVAEDVELLPPVQPSKVLCLGLNYRDHATEQNLEPPGRPLLFCKVPTAVCGPSATIEKPADMKQLDYEAELGVVVGRLSRHVREADALAHVAGYVAVNDVSARDAQFTDGQWFRGKSCDTFAPLGPALVTADEIGDPHDLTVQARVNGELRQSSRTDQLIFGVEELVAYCSRYFTLLPGDLICTGTPGGVGAFLDPPRFLADGDVVEVEIERVGTLRNPIAEVTQ